MDVVKKNLALSQVTSENQRAEPRDSDGKMFTGTNRKSEGRSLSTVIAPLDWVRPAFSQSASDGVGTKKVFKGRVESKKEEIFSQQEAEKSPALSGRENERQTAGESSQVRFPIQTTKRQGIQTTEGQGIQSTKMQGIQGHEQGSQPRRVLVERSSTKGNDAANQLTENERKISSQREKMWERMRQRKVSAPQVVPALSAEKMRNKNPRGKTYR